MDVIKLSLQRGTDAGTGVGESAARACHDIRLMPPQREITTPTVMSHQARGARNSPSSSFGLCPLRCLYTA